MSEEENNHVRIEPEQEDSTRIKNNAAKWAEAKSNVNDKDIEGTMRRREMQGRKDC